MNRFIGLAGLFIALILAPARVYAVPSTDGFWDYNNAEGYTLYKESYTEGHKGIKGEQGVLGLAIDANYLYAMFGLQLSLVDNSYGTNAVGWAGVGGHDFGELTGSDRADFRIDTSGVVSAKGATTLWDADIDYATEVKRKVSGVDQKFYESLGYNGDGNFNGGTAGSGALVAYATSLQWNLAWDGIPANSPTGNTNNNCGQATTNSPDIDGIANTNTPNATYYANQTNANCGTWVFPVIYELKLSLATLGLTGKTLAEIRPMFDAYDGHISPTMKTLTPDGEVCGDGIVGPDGSDASVQLGCSSGGNPPIPEPASLVLLGTGILGLGRAVRNRKRA